MRTLAHLLLLFRYPSSLNTVQAETREPVPSILPTLDDLRRKVLGTFCTPFRLRHAIRQTKATGFQSSLAKCCTAQLVDHGHDLPQALT